MCSVPSCRALGSLEIHHIDHDRGNNDEANLLVLCPACHPLADGEAPELGRERCEELKRALARERVRKQLETLCRAAAGEHFEDGVESLFARELVSLIQQHGDRATEALASLLAGNSIGEEVASEALRWLGLMERGPSYEARRELLEGCLSSSHAAIRDGALLGLSFLDDPHAVPHLRAAMEREARQWLREQMREVVAQLEGEEPCPSS